MSTQASAAPLVSVLGASRHYRMDQVSVPALDNVSVAIARNRFTAIVGPSGSGKSTLLNLIGCIDRPDAGTVTVEAQDVAGLTDDALADFRARRIGFVFQNFNLLPVITARENVEYPLLMLDVPPRERRERVQAMLAAVGLAAVAQHLPGQLSGGQRQRVAIARALVKEPALVLADEPTANLDSKTGADVIELMRRMQRDTGATFVFCSHDAQLIEAADDVIAIRDGRLADERGRP